MRITVSLFLSLLALSGCSTGKKLVATKDQTDCATTVEGFCHAQAVWTNEKPALLLKDGKLSKVLYGELLEVRSDGIRFDPRREGLHNPPTKLYASQEVICAVNKEGEIVYGKLPVDYCNFQGVDFYIVPANSPEGKPIAMRLKANQPFSYCITPGQYVIRKMDIFVNRKKFVRTSSESPATRPGHGDLGKYIDKVIDVPNLTFEAAKGAANYIGDLYWNFEMAGNPEVCVLTYKRTDPEGAAAAGAMLGLTGALLHAAATKEQEGVHTLLIKANGQFASATRLPQRVALLQFSKQQKDDKPGQEK